MKLIKNNKFALILLFIGLLLVMGCSKSGVIDVGGILKNPNKYLGKQITVEGLITGQFAGGTASGILNYNPILKGEDDYILLTQNGGHYSLQCRDYTGSQGEKTGIECRGPLDLDKLYRIRGVLSSQTVQISKAGEPARDKEMFKLDILSWEELK